MEDKCYSTYKKPKHQLKVRVHESSSRSYFFNSQKNLTYLNNIKNKYQVERHSDLRNLIIKKNRSYKKVFNGSSDVEELKSLFIKSHNFIEYVQGLLKINFFKKFNTIHMFIHEKGKSFANHLEVTKYELKNLERSVPDFNNLFNSIKKSKNRSFGQSGLKGLNFKIIGTFIGREFYLPKHNVIFILSRDEFLPQDQSDIEVFNYISRFIPSHINSLLTLDSNEQQIKNIKIALQNMHLPLRVLIGQKLIFSTIDDHKLIKKTILLDNMQVELGPTNELELDKADIYHKERVALLGELLNTLKHELSNPLFGLKLTTELLLMEELNSEQKEFLIEISSSLDRCTSIIENFSNLYHSENEFTEVNVYSLVEEVIKLTKSATRGIEKSIITDNNERKLIKSNPTWIVQILFNLIINSTQELNKLNPSNPCIKIQIKTIKDFLSIRISDNGKGISPENKLTIFNPFYTTKDKGTGLGLYISRSLANKLSGTLEYIQNTNSTGALFELKLPLAAAQHEHINH